MDVLRIIEPVSLYVEVALFWKKGHSTFTFFVMFISLFARDERILYSFYSMLTNIKLSKWDNL